MRVAKLRFAGTLICSYSINHTNEARWKMWSVPSVECIIKMLGGESTTVYQTMNFVNLTVNGLAEGAGVKTSSCKPIRHRTCSLNRRQSIESLFSINSILDFLFSMLMVYILLESELPIKSVYYTKISSRTAADPLEQFRYQLKLYQDGILLYSIADLHMVQQFGFVYKYVKQILISF